MYTFLVLVSNGHLPPLISLPPLTILCVFAFDILFALLWMKAFKK